MGRKAWMMTGGAIALIVLFTAVLLTGAVRIPFKEVFSALFGGETETPYAETIIMQTRLPMAIAAACCGATLSVAGLMMQTLFHNPLAGPSVLGISSGASFGVALLILSAGGAGALISPAWQPAISMTGAIAGGLLTILILYIFSSVLNSGVTLLIVGLMLSYLFASGISLLNYFSPADEIRNYLVWGLGSFTGIRLQTAIWLLAISIPASIACLIFVKPLNAMLLGERYLESVGYSPKGIRSGILILAGLLTAIPTAFCGPIGFIGLIVPHLCRLLMKTSNHLTLLPATILYGAAVTLACALAGTLPAERFGVLPINVITPVIGVPVILYLLVNRNRIPYFS